MGKVLWQIILRFLPSVSVIVDAVIMFKHNRNDRIINILLEKFLNIVCSTKTTPKTHTHPHPQNK